MKVSELDFKWNGASNGARLEFINGYGASIITGGIAYGEYEIAVLKDGVICYDSPITNDVLGYLSDDDVERVLEEIKSLPKAI